MHTNGAAKTASTQIQSETRKDNSRVQNRRKRILTETKKERKVLFPVRIPQGVLGRIVRMTSESIATGKYPWKTNGETIRALIIMGFEHPRFKGDEFVSEHLPYLKLTRQFDGIHGARTEAMASLNRAVTEIGELLGIGAKQEALQYYHVTIECASEMPPTVWRDWFLAEMKRKFRDLDKATPRGVTLGPPVPITDPRRDREFRNQTIVPVADRVATKAVRYGRAI